jgi:hypothetical protein
VTKAEDLLLKSINTVKCPNVGRMNIILTLMVALGLLTTVVAQDAKITSNRWESDTLIVSGTLSNPNGWPIEFVGFDKNQQTVTRNNDYTIQPDGTFRATLSDAKREIKFVKVEFVSVAAAESRTRPSQVQANATPTLATLTAQPSGNSSVGFVLIGMIILCYFFPTIIAVSRHHRNGSAIFLVNLFFGWSVIGWLIALIWSVTANVTPPKAVAVAR